MEAVGFGFIIDLLILLFGINDIESSLATLTKAIFTQNWIPVKMFFRILITDVHRALNIDVELLWSVVTDCDPHIAAENMEHEK